MLGCFECQNLERFVQVSTRRDARDIAQTPQGFVVASWASADARAPGIYCGVCGKPVQADIVALGLEDNRVPSVPPENFDADMVGDELESLRADASWSRIDVAEHPPRYGDWPPGLSSDVLRMLKDRAPAGLFAHQALAIQHALAGSHVVQATAAGSGKSLAFVFPVLSRLALEPGATAFLIFPLRALANDQLSALSTWGSHPAEWLNGSSFELALFDGAAPIRVARYDGATNEAERREARRHARLYITTPDMLHAGILRHGGPANSTSAWHRVLRGLAFVVLDELHIYQGVFGSNVALVLRRLRRSAAYFGCQPQFLAASATIGNPKGLAERLTGVAPFEVVDDDGSPRKARRILVCNPPTLNRSAAQLDDVSPSDPDTVAYSRVSPQTVAIELVAKGALGSWQHDPVRTISFCPSRNAVFALSQRVRNALAEAKRPELQRAVAPYAATLLARDRESAEGRLRDGTTLLIVSTNALELGIDIPELSLAVLLGYPGRVSSFRQQTGRVGRRGEGLAVLIVGDDPLQQFLARTSSALERLLVGPAEDVVVNPDAPELARRYGLAPAQEEFGGIAFEDREYFGDLVTQWLEGVTGAPNWVHGQTGYWRVPFDGDPYADIRSAVPGRTYTVFRVVGREREAVGVLDGASAPRDAFVPAIWSGADGKLFKVTGFDTRLGEIYCEGPRDDIGYQTRGIPVDAVQIREEHRGQIRLGEARLGYSRLGITRRVFSYKEQHFSGLEQTRQVEQSWPPVEFDTDGLVISLEPPADAGLEWDGAVRAFEHVLLSAAPAVVACDPYDLEATSTRSAVFLYDSFGGGLRISEPAFDRFTEVLQTAIDIIDSCPCSAGCPSCVMLARRPNGNEGLYKAGALSIARALAG